MIDFKRFVIDGNEVVFINNSRNTRSGFAHDSEMHINGYRYSKNTCYYLNRTWERYRFQSVMQGCIDNAIENCKRILKEEYKAKNGVKRMTEKHQKAFNDLLCNDKEYQLLRKIMAKVDEGGF